MEHGSSKRSITRRNFVASMGAAGLGIICTASIGRGGPVYGDSVTGSAYGIGESRGSLPPGLAKQQCGSAVASFETMDQLVQAVCLQAGAVVYTKGFYAAGDGGGAFWEIVDSATADNVFVYACGNGKYASLIHDGFVNMKQVGIKADGVKQPYTYSGTNTALDGTSRDFWVSASGAEQENYRKLQAIVSARNSVYIPRGQYVFNGIYSIRVRDHLSVIGESMSGSVLIGTGFSNLHIEDEGSDLRFENFTLENFTSILPPPGRKLKIPTDANFDPNRHWDCYNYKSVTYKDGAYKSDLQCCIVIYNSPNHPNRNITVARVKVRNYWAGTIFGTKTATEPPYRSEHIRVERCVFEDIAFQPTGSNNVRNFKVIHNTFDNVGLQPCDFSRGNIGCEFSNNTITRSASMMKVEGSINNDYTRILSDDFIIRDNMYSNPPSVTDWHYEEEFVISNLTGDGIVSGNFIEMADYHQSAIRTNIRREFVDDNVRIVHNHIMTPAYSKYAKVNILQINRSYLNGGTEYPSAGKNVSFELNDVVMRMGTTGCFMPPLTNAQHLMFQNNHFKSDGAGYLENLVQGSAAKVRVLNNTLERVRKVMDTGLWERDVDVLEVTGNRLFSDYALQASYLNQALVRVAGGNNRIGQIIVRCNETNRSKVLEIEKTTCRLIEFTGNSMKEEEGNTAQFGHQAIAVDALVDEIRFDGNNISFPAQLAGGGIIQFRTSYPRNINRLFMENNIMTYSGYLVTGNRSAGTSSDLFVFRNNKVFRIQSDPLIWFTAAKGAVSYNVFDSAGVTINAVNNLFTEGNINLAGTITIQNPRP